MLEQFEQVLPVAVLFHGLGERGQELLRASFAEAARRNVSGAPTFFLDGEEVGQGTVTTEVGNGLMGSYKVRAEAPGAAALTVTLWSDTPYAADEMLAMEVRPWRLTTASGGRPAFSIVVEPHPGAAGGKLSGRSTRSVFCRYGMKSSRSASRASS